MFWRHFATLLEGWWQTFVENWCCFGNLWLWSRIWSTLSGLLFRFCCGSLLYSFIPKLVSRFPLYKHSIKQVVQQLFNMGCFGSDGESACGLSCWDLQLYEVSEARKPTKIICNFCTSSKSEASFNSVHVTHSLKWNVFNWLIEMKVTLVIKSREWPTIS